MNALAVIPAAAAPLDPVAYADQVARAHGTTLALLRASARSRGFVAALSQVVWALRRHLALSASAIGRVINRNHTTVLYHLRRPPRTRGPVMISAPPALDAIALPPAAVSDALPVDLRAMLECRADRRGCTVEQLAVDLLRGIVRAELVDAVLDDTLPVDLPGRLPNALQRQLESAATERGWTARRLAAVLLRHAIHDDLVDAILDDGKRL